MHSVDDPDTIYEIRDDINPGDVDANGSQLRPAIVWFEEPVPMMEQAVPQVLGADIFVIIGTSLVVYPAAGLVNYVNPETPVFLLDKKIPDVYPRARVTAIEKPAATGAPDLIKKLQVLR